MRNRIISAVLAMPVGIYFLYIGGAPLTALALGLTCAAIWEAAALLRGGGISPQYWISSAGAGSYVLLAHFGLESAFSMAVEAALILSVASHLLMRGVRGALTEPAGSVFFSIYIGVPMASVILLRRIPETGFLWTVLLFTVVWATDIGAYFGGTYLGRHRLCPAISPNKTVEGAISGLALGGLAALLIVILAGRVGMELGIPVWEGFIIGAFIGVVGQLGDLVESAMKREAHVKDSGKFLPGHGGVLDRFDSIFFAAPVTYVLVRFFLAL